jgi:hypothetical protein
MKSCNLLTKILAISGTVLVGLPFIAPVVFTLIRLIQGSNFMFDYLMPAELALLVLVGAGLLIWVAIRAHSRVKLIAWTAGATILTLVGSQVMAVVSGLAHGETPKSSPWMVVVLSILIIYDLLVLFLFIAGCLLCRDVFAKPKDSVTNQ